MPERADFQSFQFPAEAPPTLIVGRSPREQRVIIGGAANDFVIADSAAAVLSASAYVLRTATESFILGPNQDLWAFSLGGGILLSVYVAPFEDDYLESGQIWHAQ